MNPERSMALLPDRARLPSGLVPVVSALLADIEAGTGSDYASYLVALASMLAPEQTTNEEVS